MRFKIFISLIFFITVYAFSQDSDGQARGSIPETLIRPHRGESARYPIDTVIGEMGRGQASEAAYDFAVSICEGLLSGDMRHASISSISPAERERYLSALEIITPVNYRIGGGREEADGAVSFLVRFIGKEQGTSGELYIRSRSGRWVFEELILDEPRNRDVEQQESIYRYDFNPYERFF